MKRYAACALCVLFILSAAAVAASYVMVSDELLVDQAEAIVVGRISAVRVRSGEGLPETVYSMDVARSLKGESSSRLEFTVPGGRTNEVEWRVPGMPVFSVGNSALLFLKKNTRGDWAPLHLMLGAFHDVADGRRRLATRNLTGTREFRFGRTESARYHQPRDLARFLDWIEERVEGRAASGDYFARPENDDIGGGFQPFTVSEGPFGNPSRWFIFDQSQSEDWRINTGGQPGFDAEGPNPPGTAGLQAALNAWNNDANSNIAYNFAGTSNNNDPNNLNAFSQLFFDDPTDLIASDFNCTQNGFSGTLGIGGPLSSNQNIQFKGQTFNPILVSRVIMNVNVECLLTFFNQATYETNITEVYTHELGHTLGIGHSCNSIGGEPGVPACESDPVLAAATMNAQAAFDGRGAAIMSDDQAAVAFLYGASQAGPGSTTQFFVQVADVLVPGFVGLRTSILIENTTGSAATATLDFFGTGTLNGSTVEAAGPINMPIVGRPLDSSYEINLDPGEVIVLETPGDSPPANFPLGFGRLTGPEGVTGTAVFVRSNSLGITDSKAGVPAIGLGTDASFIVDNRGSSSVGFALVNPPAGGGGSQSPQADANVTLRLYDSGFNLRETVNLVLEAGAHFVRFAFEVFTSTDVSDFLGSMTVTSDVPLTGLELLEDDPPGEFPANVAILTAFPVIPRRADGPLVAGSVSVSGRWVGTRVRVPADGETLAAVYRIYDGETLLARIARGGGDGELRERFRLPEFVDPGDLRVSVQLLRADGAPSRESFLRTAQ